MSASKSLVSVVIPTYNRAHLVTKAIDSVLAQTYRNYEIIVVDDGSTDNTADVLKEYSGSLRYLRQENRGAAGARNLGFQEARGKYIAFLDSDDVMLPHRLARQVELLEGHPEAVLCFGNCEVSGIVNVVALDRHTWIPFDSQGEAVIRDARVRLYTEGCFLACVAVIARLDAVREAGGMCEQLRTYEDFDLWMRLSEMGPFVALRDIVTRALSSREGLSASNWHDPWWRLLALERAYFADCARRTVLPTVVIAALRKRECESVERYVRLGWRWRIRAARVLLRHCRHLSRKDRIREWARVILPGPVYRRFVHFVRSLRRSRT